MINIVWKISKYKKIIKNIFRTIIWKKIITIKMYLTIQNLIFKNNLATPKFYKNNNYIKIFKKNCKRII